MNSITSVTHPIEYVTMDGVEIRLINSGDGTEVIHHRIEKGARWAMQPAEGVTALESVYVLEGELGLSTSTESRTLTPHQSFAAHPVEEACVFLAHEDSEFLYITSQPVFQYYSDEVQKKVKLAIEVAEKDGYTADHCKRIMKICMMMGEHQELSPDDMCTLNFASFLHDIGKIHIPEEVLQKPGKLTEEEWALMKKHPTFGREMLETVPSPHLKRAASIVEQHHERFDGKGYPNGLDGSRLSPLSSIVSVADAYDAMTTDRPYRKAMSPEAALQEIQKHKGTMFHPDVVKDFIALFPEICKIN
ncbi:HD-GYP domain-containing protein (plasmid) [Pontibacillus sp. ALD_SL1]|uniref:HD-GYP domain-containing protein n=1 Tax=Pontibacillus sp. ALD_SL1 TaxID=2777185 RepID=UPI001A964B74|nr:HD-GYP domain-containing protein [Pontibacillus sp. ALD_SL1]QST02598.1 HD-GYP domain-containing protein [Pontibacillus sp. ALD_SL1]